MMATSQPGDTYTIRQPRDCQRSSVRVAVAGVVLIVRRSVIVFPFPCRAASIAALYQHHSTSPNNVKGLEAPI